MHAVSATEFFTHALPLTAANGIRRHFASQGSISFQVADEGWTFRFGNPEPVSAGCDPEAELQLTFTAAAFSEFVAGSLDVQRAAAAGHVRAFGDLALLDRSRPS